MTALQRWRRSATSEARVYCVAHAGAGAAIVRALANAAPDWLDVVALRLPGRERRFSEPPATDVDALADAFVEVIIADHGSAPVPFLLVGQCSGAILAFEIAARLRDRCKPTGVVVCSRGGPDMAVQAPDVDAGDVEFLAQVTALGGIDGEITPEVLELLLPIMRADFRMMNGYRTASRHAIDVPILALRGVRDPGVSCAALATWRSWTTSELTTRDLDGGHFLFSDSAPAVAEEIARFAREGATSC